ncbi:hypothetical protein GCM10011584_01960 [Nocardioides phosphati]|uniref:Exo-alpha-sialidase n=1 Tax=Nocardioides phosphati TaxID=1867775 RepID=A0ABQ2N6B0_9ACTN|nr:hypothetical protein [Nocardioides phosphati]GGO84433.1 hypothetical protein GCM10011584_01960 [Nocardioides phosphati]
MIRMRALAAAALLAGGAALSACGTQPSPSPAAGHPHDAQREWRVAGDKEATADQIIDAGRPGSVATSGDRTLTTWQVQPEDDEGPSQAAWRLYDLEGARIADGKLGIVFEQGATTEVVPAPDGFVIDNYSKTPLIHVAPTGALTTIPLHAERRATRAGDVLVRAWTGDRSFYRPADHAAYRLPRTPANPQAVQLDETGRVWVMRLWSRDGDARIASAQGGVAPWTTETVDLPAGSSPTVDMAYAGGRLMFPQRSSTVAEYDEFQAIWSRSTQPGAVDHAWRSTPIARDQLTHTVTVGLDRTSTGRLLVSGESTPTLLEQADGSLRPLEVPGTTEPAPVQSVADRLYATSWSQAELYVSDDLGKSWTRVQR